MGEPKIKISIPTYSKVKPFSKTIEVKDIYREVLNQIRIAASMGKTEITIYMMEDDFRFSHIKPIVDRLTRLTRNSGVTIAGEASGLIRPHLLIYLREKP